MEKIVILPQFESFNYDMWGGTMILHFRKGHVATNNAPAEKMNTEKFLSSLTMFRKQVTLFNEQIANFSEVCLFGAAQMLPVLLYHLKMSLNINKVSQVQLRQILKFLFQLKKLYLIYKKN